MDKYTSKNLSVEEHLLFEGKLHWIVLAPGIFHLVIGLIVAAVMVALSTPFPASVIGVGLVLAGLFHIAKGIILRLSTELVCTNRKVVAKTGLISRNTVELDVARIEGIRVEQSIPGRLLNYGAVVVRGIGGMETHVTHIANPLAFRQAANAARSKTRNENHANGGV